jgi:hypothetical protein
MAKYISSLLIASFMTITLPADAANSAARDLAIKRALDAVIDNPAPVALQRYNNIAMTEDERVRSPDLESFEEQIAGTPFHCTLQQEHLPKESPTARAAWDSFLAYANKIITPEVTAEQKRVRLQLLQDAIKAGSWRAQLTDVMWDIKFNYLQQEQVRPSVDKLLDLAEQGNPLALLAVVRWMGYTAFTDAQRADLTIAAIERGNPQLMSKVGFRLAQYALAHRAKGVAMMRCALKQGDVDSYHSLGLILQMEGRWLDAYRMWVQGSNMGSDQCLLEIENLALLQPGFKLGRDTTYNALPASTKLREFYDQQFIWKLTYIPDLREEAPEAIRIRVSDQEIAKLIDVLRAR